MILGTFIFSVVRFWLIIIKLLILNSLFFLKIAFLWFLMMFAMSYLFLLLIHQEHTIRVRKDLAVEITRALGYGILLTTIIVALYEFIVQMLLRSEFCRYQLHMLQNISVIHNDRYYSIMLLIILLVSSWFTAFYVGNMLEEWYSKNISDRYGWCVILISLFCLLFLWLLA